MPQIRIPDTGEVLNAEDGETVLAAAQRAGIPFSYSCQAGNCGSCKCELIEGDIFELDHSEHALSPAERAQGLILACRTQVWGDVSVRRLSDEEIVLHPSRILRCRVARLERLTHDITGIRLAIEDGGNLLFSAGQYVNIEFAPGLSRHYSMASTPDEEMLDFQIRHMPGGRCSRFVAQVLAEDDAVTVSGPQGTSYWREHHGGPVVLIAGGSGLAPVQSILRTMLARGRGSQIKLYFGVRTQRDIYNEALLAQLAREHGNFRYEIVLSEERSGQRRFGLVHHAVEEDLDSVEGCKAYMAGPPALVEAASATLKAKGLAARDIHADAFYNQ